MVKIVYILELQKSKEAKKPQKEVTLTIKDLEAGQLQYYLDRSWTVVKREEKEEISNEEIKKFVIENEELKKRNAELEKRLAEKGAELKAYKDEAHKKGIKIFVPEPSKEEKKDDKPEVSKDK